MVSVGTVVWLSSELMFFAGLFAMYFTLRSTSSELWAMETEKLNVPFALVNTVILVSSSFSCQFGVFAAERLQAYEYAELVSEGVALSSNPFGSAFYITTGFHGIHVIGGLIAFLFIIGRAFIARQFGHFEATSAIVTSYYWHFVDVVWIGLFLIIYFLQ
jgi:cytochrome c oxidase subunit 3